MSNLQVTCIEKRGDHFDPHERIISIGGKDSFGVGWKKSESVAIEEIEKKINQFYVTVDGKKADVIIASQNGRKYLKTTADDYLKNNLLHLDSCP